MNYYAHHLGDYLRDTAHLSMLEDGAYRRLLDAYYIREASLPADEIQVCRLVRASSKQDKFAVASVLREFFTLTDLGWQHSRCDQEIARAQEKSAKARESGIASGLSRRTKDERTFNGRSTNATETLNSPITNNQEPRIRVPSSSSSKPFKASVSDRGQDVLKNGEEKRQAVAALVKGFGS